MLSPGPLQFPELSGWKLLFSEHIGGAGWLLLCGSVLGMSGLLPLLAPEVRSGHENHGAEGGMGGGCGSSSWESI